MNYKNTLEQIFQMQETACKRFGSDFTATLLEQARQNLDAVEHFFAPFAAWDKAAIFDAMLGLRFAGAIHALARLGKHPALTAHYDTLNQKNLWQAVAPVLEMEQDFITDFLRSPPQTNEVGRAGILLGGFLEIARVFNKPLALYEIGASAGLNLLWDQFYYEAKDSSWCWGNSRSAVRLKPDWQGAPLSGAVEVASRAGCDQNPVSLDDTLRLESYTWIDQPERLQRLHAALALARQEKIQVARANAAAWLADVLFPSSANVAVIYHTVVWQYMRASDQASIHKTMENFQGELAWLRFEQDSTTKQMHLLLTTLGKTQTLATAHPHGSWIRWEHSLKK